MSDSEKHCSFAGINLGNAESVLGMILQDVDTPWKRATLTLFADAVGKHGVHGIGMAQYVIEALMRDDKPNMVWMDLKTASDVLAHLKNVDVDQKKAARAYLLNVGNEFGLFLSAVINGLVESAEQGR